MCFLSHVRWHQTISLHFVDKFEFKSHISYLLAMCVIKFGRNRNIPVSRNAPFDLGFDRTDDFGFSTFRLPNMKHAVATISCHHIMVFGNYWWAVLACRYICSVGGALKRPTQKLPFAFCYRKRNYFTKNVHSTKSRQLVDRNDGAFVFFSR